MCMEPLGPSLNDMQIFCGNSFSMKTTLMIGLDMLKVLEEVHAAGFVHRDLKPSNIVLGLGNCTNQLYLIDFGISKNYRDFYQGRHMRRNFT